MKKKPFLLILLLAALFSCNTQDICDEENQSLLVARFRTTETGEIRDTLVTGVSIYGIREDQPDSLLYDSLTVSRIELPLDPNHDLSRFVVITGDKTDTLNLEHTSEAYLISYTCGFAARFTLVDFNGSGSLFTDMELVSASIDAENEIYEEHLWIYF